VPRSLGRTGYAWRQARKRVLVPGCVCHLCGHPIDLTIRWDPDHPDTGYGTVDHIVPLSRGGDPLDPNNQAPAHYGCNSRKGNRPTVRRVTSRRW
jgi:5-methylcytosine-specific restriction endonuclease McrA